VSVTAGEDAFIAAAMRCSGGTPKADLEFRLIVGMQKIEGSWFIVHEHYSVPADN